MRILGTLLLTTGLLFGCAAAPVQEMSDARQAIQAARDAGVAEHTPEPLATAEDLLNQAQQQLEMGAYREARRDALAAKALAIEALEESQARRSGSEPPESSPAR